MEDVDLAPFTLLFRVDLQRNGLVPSTAKVGSGTPLWYSNTSSALGRRAKF